MDRFTFLRFIRIFKNFSKKSSRLLPNTQAFLSRNHLLTLTTFCFHPATRTLLTLCAAIFFAHIAFEQSAHYALKKWLQAHPPSQALWATFFQAHGFHSIAPTLAPKKWIRSLPSTGGLHSSLWLSSQKRWILFYQEQASFPFQIWTQYPTVFLKKRKISFPTSWIPFPNHWSTWYQLKKQLLKLNKINLPKKRKKQHSYYDPRALSY